MIWGRTTKQKEGRKPKVGDQRTRFQWWLDQMDNGQWVWWEWVRVEWSNCNMLGWKIMEVVADPRSNYGNLHTRTN